MIHQSELERLCTHAHARVLAMLIDLAMRYAHVYPSVEYIHRETRVARSTIYLALLWFEWRGWIKRDPATGERPKRRELGSRWHHNVYILAGDLLAHVEQRKAAKGAAIAKRKRAQADYVGACVRLGLKEALAAETQKKRAFWARWNRDQKASPPIFGENLSLSTISKNLKPVVPPKSGATAFMKRHPELFAGT